MMIPYKISRTWTMVVLVALQLHCSKPEPSSETILAQIQDRTISVDELKSRAEYALRPALVSLCELCASQDRFKLVDRGKNAGAGGRHK